MSHLTEKPVELASARHRVQQSQPGERVLDLFGGSGSTLIACEQAGRTALLDGAGPACTAISDPYLRYERFTGKKAELASDGVGKAA